MEEYKLIVCQVRVRDGNIVDHERLCDFIMCKNCEYWNRHKENSYGICDNLGTITYDNFACIDGQKRTES